MLDDVVYMKSQLEIRDAKDEDTGSYQCMAVNEVAKTYSDLARINVHGECVWDIEIRWVFITKI